MKQKIKMILKSLPLILCVLCAILFLASDEEITVQTILCRAPKNLFAAAMVILVLYALKSVSIVFPIAVLQIATGYLFETPLALLVNFLGRVITLSLPYWIGRISGSETADRLIAKYPKLEEICCRHGKNPLFISFTLRTFCFLPGDAVSLYLGAIRIPFLYYLAGGVLGTALGVFLSTILGASITDPKSPAFLLSAVLMTLVALLSLTFYIKDRRK